MFLSFSWQILSKFHLRELEEWLILLMSTVSSIVLEEQVLYFVVISSIFLFFTTSNSDFLFLRYWSLTIICRRWNSYSFPLIQNWSHRRICSKHVLSGRSLMCMCNIQLIYVKSLNMYWYNNEKNITPYNSRVQSWSHIVLYLQTSNASEVW